MTDLKGLKVGDKALIKLRSPDDDGSNRFADGKIVTVTENWGRGINFELDGQTGDAYASEVFAPTSPLSEEELSKPDVQTTLSRITDAELTAELERRNPELALAQRRDLGLHADTVSHLQAVILDLRAQLAKPAPVAEITVKGVADQLDANRWAEMLRYAPQEAIILDDRRRCQIRMTEQEILTHERRVAREARQGERLKRILAGLQAGVTKDTLVAGTAPQAESEKGERDEF